MEVAVDGWRACSHSPCRQPSRTLHGMGCGVHLLLSEESLVLSCGHKGTLYHHALLLLDLVTVVSDMYVANAATFATLLYPHHSVQFCIRLPDACSGMQITAQHCKPASFLVVFGMWHWKWPGTPCVSKWSQNVLNAVLCGAAEIPVTYDQGSAGLRHLCSYLSWPVQQQLHCA